MGKEWKMREFLESATGFPAVVFTSALVVVLAFWLLAMFGAVAADSFDTDVDLGAGSLTSRRTSPCCWLPG